MAEDGGIDEVSGGSYARSGDYRNGCWEDYPPTVFDAETGEVLNPAPNPHGVRFSGDIKVTFAPMPRREPKERVSPLWEDPIEPDFDGGAACCVVVLWPRSEEEQ